LYLSVDKKLVSQNAVAVRQIESQHAIVGIEVLIVEHHGDVEIREARKPKAGGFVAGVKLIEEQVETREALVNVLGREVYAVIVIPERAHRLAYITSRRMARSKAGQHVRVMLVVPLSLTKEVARETI
jgi:hypothetical protein